MDVSRKGHSGINLFKNWTGVNGNFMSTCILELDLVKEKIHDLDLE